MCYTSPGPRCPKHVREARESALRRLEEARAKNDTQGIKELTERLTALSKDYLYTTENIRKQKELGNDLLAKKLALARHRMIQASKEKVEGYTSTHYEKWTDTTTYVINEKDGTQVEIQRNVDSPERTSYHAWYVDKGKPVAMLHYSYHHGQYHLCSIEVKESERGKQRGRKFISWVSKNVSKSPILSTGSYTPKGARSLQHGSIPDPESDQANPGVHFEDMSFVRSWENRKAY